MAVNGFRLSGQEAEAGRSNWVSLRRTNIMWSLSCRFCTDTWSLCIYDTQEEIKHGGAVGKGSSQGATGGNVFCVQHILVWKSKNKFEAGETAHQLRGLAGLSEDRGGEEAEVTWQNSVGSEFYSQPVSLGRTGSVGLSYALKFTWAALPKILLIPALSLDHVLLGSSVFAPQDWLYSVMQQGFDPA